MKYLFTYRNGKKALGLSNTNRGLAIKVENTTVYPLLVSTSAYNASCVRTKINGSIKSIAYVPSLIIPGVVCAKSGNTYIDPIGINFANTFYRECYYDNKYGDYLAFSYYKGIGDDQHTKIANSVDGRSWIETQIPSDSIIANTNAGVVVFQPSLVWESEYNLRATINAKIYYHNGSNVQNLSLLSFQLDYGWTQYTFNNIRIAKNGGNIVNLYYNYSVKDNNGNTFTYHKFYSINVNSKTVSQITLSGNAQDNKIENLWFNKILNRFFYKQTGYGYYISSNGTSYTNTSEAKVSYGNLNGAEVFADGISYDGRTVAKSYSNRPNAYDPVEGKYIRITSNWRATGSAAEYIYFIEVYESTNLNSWTKVKTKENSTPLWPQDLMSVNTDGFACVKGF